MKITQTDVMAGTVVLLISAFVALALFVTRPFNFPTGQPLLETKRPLDSGNLNPPRHHE